MAFLSIAFVIEAGIALFVRSFFPEFSEITIILIGINIVLLTLYIFKYSLNNAMAFLLLAALVIRLLLMVYDIEIANLQPHSGDDSEAFNYEATQIFIDLDNMDNAKRGIYSYFLGFLYMLFGPDRYIGQFLNIALAIISSIVFVRALRPIVQSELVLLMGVAVLMFFPQGLLLSPILMRDQIVVFGIIYMLYHVVQYAMTRRYRHMILAYVSYIGATMFHSGLAVGALALVFFFSFYAFEEKRAFPIKKIAQLLVQLIVVAAVFFVFQDSLLAKYSFAFDLQGIFNRFNYSTGDTAYLSNFKINSLTDIVLITPLKVMYFTFSPFPWQWTGALSIAIFLFDSFVYLVLLVAIILWKKYLRLHPQRQLITWMFVFVLIDIIVFAMGTNTVGTALRHRYKLFPMLFMVFIAVADVKFRLLVTKKEGRLNEQ